MIRLKRALGVSIVVCLIQGCAHVKKSSHGEGADTDSINRLDAFIQDGETLEAYGIFDPSTAGSSDAGPLLNKRFRKPTEKGSLRAKSGLPDELIKESRTQKDWKLWKPDWAKWKLDFSWMKNLSGFDHWNFEKDDPAFPSTGPRSAIFSPYPIDIVPLALWPRLRLLKGRDDGELEAALTEVRHFARLTMTVEDLITNLIGITMLKNEREFAVANKSDWKSIPEEVISKAKRFFYCTESLADPFLPKEKWERAMRLKVGQCDRISEVTKRSLMIRAYLPESAKDFLASLENMQEETANKCLKGWVRRLWKDPGYSYFEDEERVIMTSGWVLRDIDPSERTPAGRMQRKAIRADRSAREAYARGMLPDGNGFPCYRKEGAVGE